MSERVFIEEEAAGWSIISRLEDDNNIVVQLKPGDDGVEGYLSVLSIDEDMT